MRTDLINLNLQTQPVSQTQVQPKSVSQTQVQTLNLNSLQTDRKTEVQTRMKNQTDVKTTTIRHKHESAPQPVYLDLSNTGTDSHRVSESLPRSELSHTQRKSPKLYSSKKRKPDMQTELGPAQPGTSRPFQLCRLVDTPE